MSELVRFSVAMDEELLAHFDDLIALRDVATNRSEAIRDLVRDALVDQQVTAPDTEVVGTVTMVFNHHASDLSEKLDHLQHQHFQQIVSTLHVHLDQHNCLEVLILRGTSKDVHAMAEALIGTKGVAHGKLVVTTTVQILA